ncbi:MAG: transcription-repair coupling factor [Nitrosomonadaceae bacterium]|nr:transcription-repair coupling factor [Nitrosomonadaceae bacterium]
MKSSFPNGVGSSDALQIVRAHAAASTPLLLLTADAADAERLTQEVAWFGPRLRICRLPDWETLPYDQFSPHPDLVSERIATLYRFAKSDFDIGIVPVTTAMTRLAPREYMAGRVFFLRTKTRLDLDAFREDLVFAGYSTVKQVMAPGEFAIRGGIVDLFPMGSSVPYRLDLFGDEIDAIRTFDVDTQRSIYPVNEIRLLPAREFPLDKAGQNQFREAFRDRFEGDPSKSRIYKDVSSGLAPNGVEYLLPLFFDHTATVFDYVPDTTRVCLHGEVAQVAEGFWRDVKSRYDVLRGDKDHPLLPPTEIFLPTDQLFAGVARFARLDAAALQMHTQALPAVEVDRKSADPLARFKQLVATFEGRVVIAAESLGRRETIASLLQDHGLKSIAGADFQALLAETTRGLDSLHVCVAPIQRGFISPEDKLALVTENELYASEVKQARRRERNRSNAEGMLRDLAEVKVGDPVVHEQHGIGRYMGLVSMDLGEGAMEFLELHYDGNDKLFVPVAQLSVISRYTGANPEAAPLHRLGSGQWEKARRKAAEQIRDTAAELLNLYARRAARQGYAFPLRNNEFDAFSAGFAFEETPDQAAAIQAVLADMTSGKPMDRLVCGDVGFGKTEVALRAAFIAVNAGKQVAILVPTTLLAEQHHQTFSDRFAEWPVKLAEFSRFRTGKETSEAIKGLADGTIDIAIGTHKLIQKDVVFKNLGLVIIDEEHRFGVRQKEQLKALRAEVDVLTLTATPIPRTLAMSLEGLRDFSVIATAPQRRLAIKTFVNRLSDGVIREGILRELKRGGQAYYLYNEVETIQNQLEKLERLIPEARIAVAHGQLPERELERVMRDFYHQKANVLLCSTIIETGIDVPTANTILIHRADKFGLAQLHQLRGRVGRSHHQAYAYLLTPPEESLNINAKRRLEAIQAMEDLGAGFYLAVHDLEIRGAGEVLGDDQSGGITDIGFTLYTDMLNHAVKSLKAGKEPDLSKPLSVATEINLHTPALLPETYCGEVHERLVIYKRLANCEDEDALEALREELVDRFGTLPDPTATLFDSHALRILGKPLDLIKIDASGASISIQFGPDTPIHPQRVIQLVQTRRHFKLAGQDKLRIEKPIANLRERVLEIRAVLRDLTPMTLADVANKLGGNAKEVAA